MKLNHTTQDKRIIVRANNGGGLLDLQRFNEVHGTAFKKEVAHAIGFKYIVIQLDNTLAYCDRYTEQFKFFNLNK